MKKNNKKINILDLINKKLLKKIVIPFVEKSIEHKAFRPVAISIVISFILFNSILITRSHLEDYKEKKEIRDSQSKIQIYLTENGKVIDFDQMQIIEKKVKANAGPQKFLADIGVAQKQVNLITDALQKKYALSLVKAGNSMIAKYKVKIYEEKKLDAINNQNREVVLNEFRLIISPELEYVVTRVNDGEYKAEEIRQIVVKKIVKYSGVIKNGLFLDATDAGASPNTVMNMINIYSYDVDFARDIKEGDKFEILSESYFTENGRKVRDAGLLFASLDLRGKDFAVYKHQNKSGFEYFDAKGVSIKKSLLKTPVNGARISSGFGFRKHPILGYSKLHKGVDFAAPTGTPIFAAGNGTISFMGVHGGYGNFVRVKHNSEYETQYGHASKFNRKYRVGSKVKQGDVIAYVGSTGRSTGPHLHFEIVYKGKAINPASVKNLSPNRLVGSELSHFMITKNQIDAYRKKTPPLKNRL